MSVEIKPQKSGYNHKTSLCLVYVSGKPLNVGDKYPLLYHLTIKNGIISNHEIIISTNENHWKPFKRLIVIFIIVFFVTVLATLLTYH